MAGPEVLPDSQANTLRLIEAWVAAALSRARIEPIAEPRGFFADVPEAWGAWGFGETREEALMDLEAGLEGWLTLKVADGDDDIPVMGGVHLAGWRVIVAHRVG